MGATVGIPVTSFCDDGPVEVRRAAPGDAGQIVGLLNAHLSTTTIEWTETPYQPEDMGRWLNAHEVALVAEEGGDIVGLAAFTWSRDVEERPGYRFPVENTIHVRRDHWRGGVGRQLMMALIEHARQSGKHTMVAAMDGATVASIRFHEQSGFVEAARMPEVGAKFGRWQDLVLFQLRRDSPPTPDDG